MRLKMRRFPASSRRVAGTGLALFSAVAALTAEGQNRSDRRLQERIDEADRRETEALVVMVDQAMAGRAGRSDFAVTWRNDFLKAQPGTFVPFTIAVAPGALASARALMYVRVVNRDEPGDRRDASQRQRQAVERYPFDAVFPVEVVASPGQPLRISRGFAVPPGEYDVYVALKERPVGPGATGGRLKAALLKQALRVPDFWSGELTTSTVMLADRIDVLPAPIAPEESASRPYVIGLNDVHLAWGDTFRKDRELLVVFVIYNPAVTPAQQFDIQVDYHLYRQEDGRGEGGAAPPPGVPAARAGERYVTRTTPQRFNPSVLGARVDPGAGHPVLAGQGILLSSFEAGAYRLGITVTDLIARRTVTRDVTFRVVES
jgi:hypothetical protein